MNSMSLKNPKLEEQNRKEQEARSRNKLTSFTHANVRKLESWRKKQAAAAATGTTTAAAAAGAAAAAAAAAATTTTTTTSQKNAGTNTALFPGLRNAFSFLQVIRAYQSLGIRETNDTLDTFRSQHANVTSQWMRLGAVKKLTSSSARWPGSYVSHSKMVNWISTYTAYLFCAVKNPEKLL